MKHKILLILLVCCIAAVCGGCPIVSTNENKPRLTAQPPAQQQEASAPQSGSSFSRAEIQALFDDAFTERPELFEREAPDEPICTDYTDKGFLRVSYEGEPGVKYKLQVLKDNQNIVYNLFADGSVQDFSLQFGDGKYTARIMENIRNDEYFAAESENFRVKMDGENIAFLTSVQNIDWNYDMRPIEDVPVVISDALTQQQRDLIAGCVRDAYRFVTDNVEYDDGKIFDLQYNYLPDIEQTYADRTGICYDYSALLASMLRSLGIPAKLVKGYASYAPDTYHAWNEVYLNGRWIVIDATYDASLPGEFNSSNMEKDTDDYAKVYEY